MPTAAERAGDFSHSLNSSGQQFFIADPLLAQQGLLCSSTVSTGCFHDPSRSTAANPTGLNIIPLNRFNPSTAALLTVFPLPNTDVRGTNGGLLYNFVTQRSVDVPKHSLLLRFDVNPTSKDHIFWKRQWFTSDNVGLGTSGWPSGDQNRWGILSHYI